MASYPLQTLCQARSYHITPLVLDSGKMHVKCLWTPNVDIPIACEDNVKVARLDYRNVATDPLQVQSLVVGLV